MKYLLLLSIIPAIMLIPSCSQNKNPLPEEIFGLRLQNKLSGSDAKKYIDRLHLREVTPEKNEVGFYSGEAANAVVYITHYDESETALAQEKNMIGTIPPENPVFFGADFISINGRELYRCLGMGQAHFIYSSDNKLFWISVDSYISKMFIEEYLNYVE